MMAVDIAVKSVTKDRHKIHVHVKTDNVTTVRYVNKMGGTKSQKMTHIAKQVWQYCLMKEITITAEHLPGILNKIADWESRHVSSVSTNNWKLNPDIFKQIDHLLGPLELDLFAERMNAQISRYFSWKPDPLAVGSDAFTKIWTGEKAYAFPPFCLIPRVLAKIQKEKAQIVLIAPAWHTQAFYPMLLEMIVNNPILLPPQKDLLLSPEGHCHPLVSKQHVKTSGMADLRQTRQMQGLSADAAELWVSAWRSGTQSSLRQLLAKMG